MNHEGKKGSGEKRKGEGKEEGKRGVGRMERGEGRNDELL